MLSEAYDLRRSLDETGFDVPVNHPDVKRPGKNPGYRVYLRANGPLQIVEEVDRESMGQLWYHREGKANAFPVVKIQHALLSVPIDDPLREKFDALKKTEQTQRRKLLREAIDNREFQLPAHDEQTWNRLRKKGLDWLNIFAEADDQYLALPCMLRRFVTSMTSPADFLRYLCQLIVQRLEQGHLQEVTLAQKLLVGVPDKKRPDKPAKAEVPVVFDVEETNYHVLIADPKMASYVSHRFRAIEISEPNGICALKGEPQLLLKRRFPEPNLGALGETKLFSKNKDTPCEFRYIKNLADWQDASKSFPVGQKTAADIADGLSALTVRVLRGKTWRMVANGNGKEAVGTKERKKTCCLFIVKGNPL